VIDCQRVAGGRRGRSRKWLIIKELPPHFGFIATTESPDKDPKINSQKYVVLPFLIPKFLIDSVMRASQGFVEEDRRCDDHQQQSQRKKDDKIE